MLISTSTCNSSLLNVALITVCLKYSWHLANSPKPACQYSESVITFPPGHAADLSPRVGRKATDTQHDFNINNNNNTRLSLACAVTTVKVGGNEKLVLSLHCTLYLTVSCPYLDGMYCVYLWCPVLILMVCTMYIFDALSLSLWYSPCMSLMPSPYLDGMYCLYIWCPALNLMVCTIYIFDALSLTWWYVPFIFLIPTILFVLNLSLHYHFEYTGFSFVVTKMACLDQFYFSAVPFFIELF